MIKASTMKISYIQSAKNQSLFAGFSTVFYVSFPGTALYFLGYDGTKRLFELYAPSYSENFASMIGGISAEVLCNTFRNPFEVVKQQMQVGLDPTIRQTCRSIYQAKGLLGNNPIIEATTQVSCLCYSARCPTRWCRCQCTRSSNDTLPREQVDLSKTSHFSITS